MAGKEKPENGKLKVGFYNVTGCAGCLLSVIYTEGDFLEFSQQVDIVSFPFIKEKNDDEQELDVAFIEGVVVTKADEETVKKIRERSKMVVALGACAHLGNIPALAKMKKSEDLEYLKYKKEDFNMDREGGPAPLHTLIKIDYTLPGCPPDRDEIRQFMKYLLLGKTFRNYNDPVCVECKLRNNGCLLDQGKICLGPIIAGGCKAVCPSGGLKCYGCRGFVQGIDKEFDGYFRIMEDKGFSLDDVKRALETFMAIDAHKVLDEKFAQYQLNRKAREESYE
ncbi:MAG: hypothetical protein KC535_05135 [Nanoarchaeota archaeon]|nr:hypothetical protein [Nanoarchaeota archaeon]